MDGAGEASEGRPALESGGVGGGERCVWHERGENGTAELGREEGEEGEEGQGEAEEGEAEGEGRPEEDEAVGKEKRR